MGRPPTSLNASSTPSSPQRPRPGTRAERRVRGLPSLPPPGGKGQEAVPGAQAGVKAPEPMASQSPAATAASRSSGAAAPPAPSDGEMNTVYLRWKAKADKTKAD